MMDIELMVKKLMYLKMYCNFLNVLEKWKRL